MGVLYDNARDGAAQDGKKAAELYTKACDMGNGGGCYDLGLSIRAKARRQRGRKRSRKNTSKKRAK
jgi:beta-lactamase hcpA|nr:hypothetical protein [uncultured Campylobacter sp.]